MEFSGIATNEMEMALFRSRDTRNLLRQFQPGTRWRAWISRRRNALPRTGFIPWPFSAVPRLPGVTASWSEAALSTFDLVGSS
jgi:hypothetical protein